ncbi:MAG: serine/threonine protein kinase [Ktedonobacteraceae bacterium]|nr:serine/threonine protein kinase [Ktedonobacteraceae bacterium]
MNIETHDIPCSLDFDQPDVALRPLLRVLQQITGHFQTAPSGTIPDCRNLLIVDMMQERASYLAHLLVQAGYRPITMASTLEAFTRFLQVPFVPFAIILGQDEAANYLFLRRFLQQTAQKYGWVSPLIRLRFLPIQPQQSLPLKDSSSPPQPPAQTPHTPLPPFAPSVSSPLPPYETGGLPNVSSSFIQQSEPLSDPQNFGSGSLIQASHAFMSPPPAKPLPPVQIPSGPLSSHEQKLQEMQGKKLSLAGQSIGRYAIMALLGDRADSHAYRAYDRLREQDIVLKAFQTNALPYVALDHSLEEMHFFEQEAELLRPLHHSHIAPIWNTGKSYVSGTPFIYKTMPYFAEGSLAQWIRRQTGSAAEIHQRFSPREVGHILLQLADALQYLHSNQVTFQNFKLSNVLIRNNATSMSQLDVVLADFAIPQDGSFFSRTPQAYSSMAPERWQGQASPASDQYGLAVLVYELLAGRPPFQGSTERTMKLLHTNMPPQPPGAFNPALPQTVNHVLLRALAKKPDERFASVAAFAQAFQRYCM